jgi:hypothetical protein
MEVNLEVFDDLFKDYMNKDTSKITTLGELSKHQDQIFNANFALQKILKETIELLKCNPTSGQNIETVFQRLNEIVNAYKKLKTTEQYNYIE